MTSDGFYRHNSADQEKKLDADLVQTDGLVLYRLRNVHPPMSVIVDETDPNSIYVGEAEPGADQNLPVWRIKQILTTGTMRNILYANGNAAYTNVWADRATLTYIS